MKVKHIMWKNEAMIYINRAAEILKRYRYWFIFGLLLTFSILFFSKSRNGEDELQIIRPVLTKTITLDTSTANVLEFAGVSRADYTAPMSFRIGGQINLFPAKMGDRVFDDQLIAKLDSDDYESHLREAEANYFRTKASFVNAKEQYKRTKSLRKTGASSQSDLDIALSSYRSARADLRGYKASLDIAVRQLDYTQLTFKVPDGKHYDKCFVSATYADERENVVQGQLIATIECFDSLKVDVSVPENFITKVKYGDEATVWFNGDIKITGYATEVGVSSTSGTNFYVTVLLPNTEVNDAALRPGMSAKIAFSEKSTDIKPTIVIPYHTVDHDENGRFVYLFKRDPNNKTQKSGKVEKIYIETSGQSDMGFIVSDGIKEGDVLVTAGIRYLYNGREVTQVDG